MLNLFPKQRIDRAYLIFDIISEDLLNTTLSIPTFQFTLTHCSVIDKGIISHYAAGQTNKINEW